MASAATLAGRAKEQWTSYDGSVDGGPNSYFYFGTIDGKPQAWTAHNAGRDYCCQLSRNGRVLRLELRAGDQWRDEAAKGAKTERTLVQAVTDKGSFVSPALPLARDVWWAFSFMVEPGPPVSALAPGYDWLIMADVHSDFSASRAVAVPIQFELAPADFFDIQTHGTNLFPNNARNMVYRASRPIERGTWHDFVVRVNMDPVGADRRSGADAFLDGEQVLAYAGPLGFENDRPYAQFQIYRSNPDPETIAHETVSLRYANHEMLTGGSLLNRVRRR